MTLAPAAAGTIDQLSTQGLPPLRTGVLSVVRPVVAGLLRRLYDVREHGLEHLPSEGPVILAANHIGALDGPLLVAVRPGAFALAKQELFSSRVGGLLRFAGQIPVARREVDVRAVRRCVQVLQQGGSLVIFPEGKRGLGDMSHVKRGAAYLAMVTGAPIVPVALLGTRLPGADERSYPPLGSRLHIVYGGEVRLPTRGWPRRATDVAAQTELLAARLRDHVRWAELTTGTRLPATRARRNPHERAQGPGTLH